MALRAVPIHRSGNRPSLFMGGDREMVMLSALMVVSLIFNAMNWTATLYGLFLWFASLYLFRMMGKNDPKMRQVYMRHRRYQRYYPARSTPFRNNTSGQGERYK